MSELIISGGESPFDAIRRVRPDGSEYWSARDLMPLLGYHKWERFEMAIDRATVACENSGSAPADHFPGAGKNPSELGGRPARDRHLSRYGAYLVAMNGDPRKPEIAAAQTYFAVKTREAETRATTTPALPSNRELALMVIAESDRAAQAEAKVKELEPSAQAWDVMASTNGDYSLRDAAYILNRDAAICTGPRLLKGHLADFGMIDRRGVPYSKHKTHLVQRARTYEHPHTGEEMQGQPQLRVTYAGLRYLHRKLGGVAPLRFEQLSMGA